MQAQTARRLQEFRFNRYIIGTIAVVGLAVASIFAFQALTRGETAIESQELSPVNLLQEDPPLPAGWVDSYFSSGAADIYVEQDPPLPAGWVDPYFGGTKTGVRMVEEARFLEQNSFDYDSAETTTVEGIQTLEANSWDYPVRAQVAGDAAQPPADTVDEMRFIEENTINLPNATAQGEIVPYTPS